MKSDTISSSKMLRPFLWSFAVPMTILWLTNRFDSSLLENNYLGQIVVRNNIKGRNKVDTKPVSVRMPNFEPKVQNEQPRKEQPPESMKDERFDSRLTPLLTEIEKSRKRYKAMKSSANANDGSDHLNIIYETLILANLLHQREVEIHDGGTTRQECLSLYQEVLSLLSQDNDEFNFSFIKIEEEEFKTRLYGDYNDYIFMDLKNIKSKEGLLLRTYTSLGKQFFMSNLFENAVEMLTNALQIEPNYVDALGHRGSNYVILGKYKEAGQDYARVLSHDKPRFVIHAFTGAAKVLTVIEKETETIPGLSWDKLIEVVVPLIESQEKKYKDIVSKDQQNNELEVICERLKTQHLTMFAYHDQHTQNYKWAWHHLSEAYRYKMIPKPPYQFQTEQRRVDTIKTIFTRTFFPEGIGDASKRPIFIIGFPRSGSTLLERILDAHSETVGTGEDSVFNGRLSEIRDAVVQASTSGNPQDLQNSIKKQAQITLKIMKERHISLLQHQQKYNRKSKTDNDLNDIAESNLTTEVLQPRRFVDKMLTNYMNVGFIHLLFPNALILHIAREPMDTLFSAYKMDFPPGGLDYTSEIKSLAHMYGMYRNIMEHWDDVLPGRVTHVRYEDLVNDTSNVAKALIAQTGLSWQEDILQFHKKKHAVNTLSSTQVRKGIYKDSIQSWRKYEEYLIPLQNLVGPRYTKHTTKTTLKYY